MKGKIHLLFTEDSLTAGGGKERLLITYLRDLDRNRFDVHLVLLNNKGALIPQAQQNADHSAIFKRKLGLDPYVLWQLRKYIINNRIQIIHTSQWLDSLYVLLASIGLPVRRIASVHGYNYTWRNQVNQWVLKKFDRIICVSKSLMLDVYKAGFPWGKISLVYNCYDEKRFQRRPSLFKKKADVFKLCMVGRFDWIKDQATLCRAVGSLKKRNITIELTLVGGGDANLERECKSICTQFGIEKDVQFLGMRDDVPEILSNMDAFVFSSFCDTFGIALIEAMACGLPVIVSDIPPFMEIIEYGKYGQYFRTGDPEDCADKICMLINDYKLQESYSHCSIKRAGEFTSKRSIIELEDVYYQFY